MVAGSTPTYAPMELWLTRLPGAFLINVNKIYFGYNFMCKFFKFIIFLNIFMYSGLFMQNLFSMDNVLKLSEKSKESSKNNFPIKESLITFSKSEIFKSHIERLNDGHKRIKKIFTSRLNDKNLLLYEKFIISLKKEFEDKHITDCFLLRKKNSILNLSNLNCKDIDKLFVRFGIDYVIKGFHESWQKKIYERLLYFNEVDNNCNYQIFITFDAFEQPIFGIYKAHDIISDGDSFC